MSCTAAHLRSRSLNIVLLSDMMEGSYRSWDLYTTGQLVDCRQHKRKSVFIERKWNHVVFSRATILSFHNVESTQSVWKKLHFILSDRFGFQMIDNLLVVVNASLVAVYVIFSKWDAASEVAERLPRLSWINKKKLNNFLLELKRIALGINYFQIHEHWQSRYYSNLNNDFMRLKDCTEPHF